MIWRPKVEDNTALMGGFDNYEFMAEELLDIIKIIKELDNEEYDFVMQNTLRYRGNAK
jgi:hypothetical protein